MPRLDEIASGERSMASHVEWRDAPTDMRQSARHDARVSLSVDGVGKEGLFLRLWCPKTLNAWGFGVQLEYHPANRRAVALARMDWKVGHTNSNRGPAALRLMDIPSTHIHSFEHNYFETGDRMLSGNLPVATPIDPDPDTAPEFLAVAGKLLRIRGLAEVTRPPYQGALL